ncbi:uncharacterized protein MKK02DRAFT_38345 [Dioszegia hungarica]|uniref:Uncharacterized protein n=1 Tax=Dioszegia hungarica TaxID=4972 RepID=A0AA38LQZ6_9TREE|nr:uncharacterized protein MKK02DRAFT_38345 [Dioszegia hungarica]KAI9633687.1 hypothetical protein MKK02DRAFT_38345 [Dioszegia hungarica]
MSFRVPQRLSAPLILGGIIALYLLYTLSTASSPTWVPSLRGSAAPPRVLLVTAYYPLKKSKHPQSDYDHWLTNLMGQLSTDMYIFTSSSYEAHLQGLIARAVDSDLTRRRNHTGVFAQRKVYYDTRYSGPLETPPLAEFAKVAQEQWDKDGEKAYHNPDLYAVWDSKAYFVGEAVRAMADLKAYDKRAPTYKYVFWEDAGAMRADHLLQAWPDMDRLDSIFSQGAATVGSDPSAPAPLVMFPLWRKPQAQEKAWGEEKGPLGSDIVEGSFFGGTPSSVLWFESTFYALFDRLLAKGFFVGKDQTVFNLVMSLNPTNFFGPIPREHNDVANWGANPCGDTWYYYHQWLASAAELAETEKFRGNACPMVEPEFPFL